MAFSSTVTDTSVFGDRKVVYGTFTNSGGSTGGDIDTGMDRVDFISLQVKGSSVVSDVPVVNETLPCSGNAVTVVTTANAIGYWFAIGK